MAAATEWWAWCRQCRRGFPVATAGPAPQVVACLRCGATTTRLQAILSDRPSPVATGHVDEPAEVA